MAKLQKRKSLGKGLSALLADTSFSQKEDAVSKNSAISEIPLEYIEVNPYQPRTEFDKEALEELAASIKLQGIIQPITVRKLSNNSYQLISGERRLQASKIAKLERIPAFLREANDQQMLELAIIENIQRENLNPMEIALSYQRLMSECSLKQEELGDRVGKKRTTVTNYLRLLKLPPDLQTSLRNKKLSMGHAKVLAGLEDIGLQLSIHDRIIAEGWSVRKTESFVRDASEKVLEKDAPKEKSTTTPNFETKKVQDKLASHFGSQVRIKATGKEKGEIKIPFQSTEDLNRILDILNQ